MNLLNYFPDLAEIDNLYIVTNDKLLTVIKSAYNDIKFIIGTKKFTKISGFTSFILITPYYH